MVSDIATSQYGTRARRLVDLAEALRGIGAHELLNIPQIVVIGGQSAGKSSLVEAVSGIRVPRDSGTCTRCPMECNLKRDPGPWSCQVTLRVEYDAANNPLPAPQLVRFGLPLTDPGDVELMLRRAQAALLCPWLDPAVFVTMEEGLVRNMVKRDAVASSMLEANGAIVKRNAPNAYPEGVGVDLPSEESYDGSHVSYLVSGMASRSMTPEAQVAVPFDFRTTINVHPSTPLKFSRNTICIEIKDSGAANLSFVDLPGLIQNEEPKVVQLVEGLVREFITKKCLILVTIPMSDDMENQRAKRLAKEVDPDGVRTIGVLTKPDTLTSGSISAVQKWKEILLSNSSSSSHHTLRHGYFCVKLADDVQRANEIEQGTPRAQRQALELAFFSSVEPWAGMRGGNGRERFGIVNLVSEMSRLLTGLLDDALPGMRAEAERQLSECRAALRRIPVPPHVDAIVEILRLVTEFCQDLKSRVYGGSGIGIGVLYNQVDRGGGYAGLAELTAFVRGNRSVYEEFKRQIRATAPDFRPFEHGEKYARPAYDNVHDSGTTMDLIQMRDLIKKSITWELPHNVPFAAKQFLIGEFLAEWDVSAQECYESVAKRLENELISSVDRIFGKFPQLKDHIRTLVMEELSGLAQSSLVAVNKAIELEKYPYSTMNTSCFVSLREKWIVNYRDVRKRKNLYVRQEVSAPVPMFMRTSSCGSLGSSPASCCYDTSTSQLERAISALAELGYEGITSETLKRLNPPDDEFEEEIVVMGDVRAYFEVAYKRIVDAIPLTIEHSLNQALCSTLQVSLFQKLDVGGANASERLSKLLAEDPKVLMERKKLQGLKEKLEKILAELKQFGA